MNINLNQYEINRAYQNDLQRQAEEARMANSAHQVNAGISLITAARNSVGNLLTNVGASLQERYAEPAITVTTTGTFSKVEA